MTTQDTELVYAVRPQVVLKYLGQLCIVLCVLFAVPLGASLLFGDLEFASRYAAVVLLTGLLGAFQGRLPIPKRIQANEALVISAAIFLVASLLMTYPMMASGLPFVDALFESVSAVTTTGLSVVGSVAEQPRTFLLSRAWGQWFGGLGIIVLSVAIITRPGMAARELSGREPESDDLAGSTRARARTMLRVYALLTVGGFVLLAATGTGVFSALVHTLAAVSTGGFSPYDESLGGLAHWGQRALVIALCASGSVSLTLYAGLRSGGLPAVARDLQLRVLLLAGSIVTLLLVLLLHHYDGLSWWESLGKAPLLGFSAQTTAGFSPTDVSRLAEPVKLLLLVPMLAGGAVGSTAGGVKLLRFLIVLRILQVMIRRTCLPRHAVIEPRLRGRRVEAGEIDDVLSLVLLFVGVIVVSWFPFLLYGHAVLDSLFEVVSATGTVGLSSGISRPELAPFLKLVLCSDMLLGRLEIIALLVLIYPRTWIGRRLEVA